MWELLFNVSNNDKNNLLDQKQFFGIFYDDDDSTICHKPNWLAKQLSPIDFNNTLDKHNLDFLLVNTKAERTEIHYYFMRPTTCSIHFLVYYF